MELVKQSIRDKSLKALKASPEPVLVFMKPEAKIKYVAGDIRTREL